MANLSEKAEGALIGTASALAAIGTFAATQPIPDAVKIPIVATSGAISAGLYAFWYGFVNKKPQTNPTAP